MRVAAISLIAIAIAGGAPGLYAASVEDLKAQPRGPTNRAEHLDHSGDSRAVEDERVSQRSERYRHEAVPDRKAARDPAAARKRRR